MTMRYTFTILILVLTLTAFKCGKDSSTYTPSVTNYPKGLTPQGVEVYSFESVSDASRQLIDNGLDKTFRNAEAEYPSKEFPRHADYRAGLFKPDPRCIEKAFIVAYYKFDPNDPYDQSEYDKDPALGRIAICVAGKFGYHTNLQGVRKNLVSLVDDPEMLVIGAQFEAEHAVLLVLDPARYAATMYHQNGGHPILREAEMAKLANSGIEPRYIKIPDNAPIPKTESLKAGDEFCILLVK